CCNWDLGQGNGGHIINKADAACDIKYGTLVVAVFVGNGGGQCDQVVRIKAYRVTACFRLGDGKVLVKGDMACCIYADGKDNIIASAPFDLAIVVHGKDNGTS